MEEMSIFQLVVNYFSSFSAVLRGSQLYQPHTEKRLGTLDCDFSLKEIQIIENRSGATFCYLHLNFKA